MKLKSKDKIIQNSERHGMNLVPTIRAFSHMLDEWDIVANR